MGPNHVMTFFIDRFSVLVCPEMGSKAKRRGAIWLRCPSLRALSRQFSSCLMGVQKFVIRIPSMTFRLPTILLTVPMARGRSPITFCGPGRTRRARYSVNWNGKHLLRETTPLYSADLVGLLSQAIKRPALGCLGLTVVRCAQWTQHQYKV